MAWNHFRFEEGEDDDDDDDDDDEWEDEWPEDDYDDVDDDADVVDDEEGEESAPLKDRSDVTKRQRHPDDDVFSDKESDADTRDDGSEPTSSQSPPRAAAAVTHPSDSASPHHSDGLAAAAVRRTAAATVGIATPCGDSKSPLNADDAPASSTIGSPRTATATDVRVDDVDAMDVDGAGAGVTSPASPSKPLNAVVPVSSNGALSPRGASSAPSPSPASGDASTPTSSSTPARKEPAVAPKTAVHPALAARTSAPPVANTGVGKGGGERQNSAVTSSPISATKTSAGAVPPAQEGAHHGKHPEPSDENESPVVPRAATNGNVSASAAKHWQLPLSSNVDDAAASGLATVDAKPILDGASAGVGGGGGGTGGAASSVVNQASTAGPVGKPERRRRQRPRMARTRYRSGYGGFAPVFHPPATASARWVPKSPSSTGRCMLWLAAFDAAVAYGSKTPPKNLKRKFEADAYHFNVLERPQGRPAKQSKSSSQSKK